MTLVFLLAGQTITRMDRQPIAAKSINFLRAQFVRGEGWEDDGIITPVFSAGGKSYTPAITPEKTFLDENGICLVPHEVLDGAGMMTVTAALYVESEQKRVTVNAVCVPVGESGYTEAEESLTPTPDVYEQLMADYQQMVSGLENVQKNGLFKNDDGAFDAKGSEIVELKSQTIEDFEFAGNKAATTGGVFDLVEKAITPTLQAAQQTAEAAQKTAETAQQTAETAQQTAETAQQTAETAQQSFDLLTEKGGDLNGNYQTDAYKVQGTGDTPVYRMYNSRYGSELIHVDQYGNIEAAGLSVGVGNNAKAVATQENLQNADTAAQGYATTAQENAIQQASTLAQAAQSAAETAAQQYADAAQQAAEAAAQEYADAAEAAAKAAAPSDLLLTGRLLQLAVGGVAIGDGVQLPQETMELWNDITLEEDVLNITKTKTDDGRPIRAKKLFLLFIGKTQGGGIFMLRNAAATLYNVYTNVTKPENTGLFWAMVEKIADGVYFSQYSEDIVDVSNIPDLSNIAYSGSTSKGNLASNVTFQEGGSALYNSINFGGLPATPTAKLLAGSRIRIWGVMDDD